MHIHIDSFINRSAVPEQMLALNTFKISCFIGTSYHGKGCDMTSAHTYVACILYIPMGHISSICASPLHETGLAAMMHLTRWVQLGKQSAPQPQ